MILLGKYTTNLKSQYIQELNGNLSLTQEISSIKSVLILTMNTYVHENENN